MSCLHSYSSADEVDLILQIVYVPGQSVAVGALVTNNSNVPISAVRVKIVKVLTLNLAHGPIADRSRVFTSTVGSTIIPANIVKGQSKSVAVSLNLPAGLASHFSVNSELVQCEYFVRVKAVTSSQFASNAVTSIPFTYDFMLHSSIHVLDRSVLLQAVSSCSL